MASKSTSTSTADVSVEDFVQFQPDPKMVSAYQDAITTAQAASLDKDTADTSTTDTTS